MKRFGTALAAALLMLASDGRAQEAADTARIAVRALSSPNRVVLRWGPTTPAAWLAARSDGYRIERAAVGDRGAIEGEFMPLGSLQPWTPDEWDAALTPDRMFAALTKEALHGLSFTPEPATGYLAGLRGEASELNFRFGFSLMAADLDSLAAEGLAVRYVDESVQPDRSYMYRVFLGGSTAVADTGYVLVDAVPSPPLLPPVGFEAYAGDGRILLTWDHTASPFTAFWLDRSDDGGTTFRRLTASPILPASRDEDRVRYIDSTVVNYRAYRYRLRGVSPFALLSPASEVEIVPRDLTPPPAPLLIESTHVRESTVSLAWTVDGSMPSDLAGFRIGIAADPEGPFDIDPDRLLAPGARRAEDSRAVSHLLNYYVVVAVDTAGNAAPSLPRYVHVVDTLPPSPPLGLTVLEMDTSGVVRIGWRMGEEPDLFGYRVARANQPDHAFLLRTGDAVRDTVFADSLQFRSLTRDVYYRVTALDRNYNASAPSGVLRVRLPDLVRPVAPVFQDVTPTDSSVLLVWVPSSSGDVARQTLLRRESGSVEWMEIRSLAVSSNRFEDRDVEKRRAYEYTIVAEDSAGLRSLMAQPVRARPYDTGVRPGVRNLSAAVDPERRAVRLSWDYPALEGDYWFVVYRGLEDGPLTRYRSAGPTTTFEDIEIRLRREESFRYAVQVYHRDGGTSPLSEAVGVVVPGRD